MSVGHFNVDSPSPFHLLAFQRWALFVGSTPDIKSRKEKLRVLNILSGTSPCPRKCQESTVLATGTDAINT
jgi:hypothetical protein